MADHGLTNARPEAASREPRAAGSLTTGETLFLALVIGAAAVICAITFWGLLH
jgi:hypothetical protein